MEITYDNGSDAYLGLLAVLLGPGAKPVHPRGLETREVLDVTLRVTHPHEVHVLRTIRKPSLQIAATEAMHLVGGLSSLEQLDLASNGKFNRFSDDGLLRGAYGPRTYDQLVRVARLLKDDPDTRRAMVTVWRGPELAVTSRDVPCTTALQFLVRENRLQMRVSMRSNDAWLGLPYDLMMFSCLHRTLAASIGVVPGPYVHTVGSFHLYEDDVEKAYDVLEEGLVEVSESLVTSSGIPVPPSLGSRGSLVYPTDFENRALAAREVCLRHERAHVNVRDETMLWLMNYVPLLERRQYFCSRCRYVTRGKGKCVTCGSLLPERVEAILEEVRREYSRARDKHGEYTLDGNEVTDVTRLAALVEEVGEAAREMTYDHADPGAEARLRTELVQVANVALTWASVLPTGE